MTSEVYLRRAQAAEYLRKKYGFGSEKSLAKIACVSSAGPKFCKAGRIVLYEPASLDEWAKAKIGPPQKSTSDTGGEA